MSIRYTLTARSKRCDSSPKATITNQEIISVQWMNKTGDHEIEKLICSRQVQIVVKTENAANEKIMLAVKNPNRALTITNHDLKMSYFEEDDGMVIAIGDIDCNGIARFDFCAEKSWFLDGELINNELTAIAFIYDGIKVIPKKEDTVETTISVAEKIVIVLDPGHGTEGGGSDTEAGTQCKYYRHYKKGNNGKPTKESTDKMEAIVLPDYVVNDPTTWISEIIGYVPGTDQSEWSYVVGVAESLEILLKNQGFGVFLTRRNIREKNRITNYGVNLKERVDFVNINNTDYFISIHVNGGEKNDRGYTVLYPKNAYSNKNDKSDVEASKILGADLFKFYNVVSEYKAPYNNYSNNKRVLYADNLAKRRVIIEVGFFSNISDIRNIIPKKSQIAPQLFQGLLENINKFF